MFLSGYTQSVLLMVAIRHLLVQRFLVSDIGVVKPKDHNMRFIHVLEIDFTFYFSVTQIGIVPMKCGRFASGIHFPAHRTSK